VPVCECSVCVRACMSVCSVLCVLLTKAILGLMPCNFHVIELFQVVSLSLQTSHMVIGLNAIS